MTILSDRWRGFRKIPHVPLAELPTAVVPAPSLSARAGAEIWIKRDDATAPRYGGNKVRKLEYLIGEAIGQGADSFVTAGAAGSHHALASAIFGAQQGLRVHAVLMPQRFSSHAEDHLRALLGAGAEVHAVPSSALVLPALSAIGARLRLTGRRPYVVGPGGSNVAGVIGHVEAGLELARQIEAGVLPEPDAVFVALGSGGTAAGLAIGLAAAGLVTQVIAVRVVPRAMASRSRLRTLIGRTVAHLRTRDDRFPDVASIAANQLVIDHADFGQGYGAPTSEGRNAARLAREHAGLELDPTYTAKTFSALLRYAATGLSGRRLLYVHTLSSADLDPWIASAPPLPLALARLLVR